MRILVVSLYFLLRLIRAHNDTLQDVTLEWKFSINDDPITSYVESSDDLSEHLPGIYLKVKGTIPTVHSGIFKNIPKLRSLTISDIGLREIRAEAFQNFPNVGEIECNNNNISEIKSGSFSNLNVTTLQLNNDKIKILEKGAFQNLLQLKRLSLRDNQLEEIGKGVFSNISPSFLDLTNNLISRLEAGVFEKIICQVYYSLSVNLYNNKLKEIDPEAFSHEKIEKLELGKNEISQLRPGDFKNMPKLNILLLSHNRIESIPENTFPATLQTLDLSSNQIAHISSQAFDGMRSLTRIHLSHNQLTRWDPSWFSGSLASDSQVFAAYNYIEELPDDAFKNMPQMRKIDLGKNRIRSISPDAFRSLTNLQLLLLNDNDIGGWDKRICGTRDHLKIDKIDLRRNRLQCLEGDFKEIFRNVGDVWLEPNPISADCLEKVEKYKKGTRQHGND